MNALAIDDNDNETFALATFFVACGYAFAHMTFFDQSFVIAFLPRGTQQSAECSMQRDPRCFTLARGSDPLEDPLPGAWDFLQETMLTEPRSWTLTPTLTSGRQCCLCFVGERYHQTQSRVDFYGTVYTASHNAFRKSHGKPSQCQCHRKTMI